MGQSFTQIVKEELVNKPFSEDRKKALLAAFIKINGRFQIRDKHELIYTQTENAKIAKYVFKLVSELYNFTPRVEFLKTMKLNKRVTYSIIIDNDVTKIISDLDINILEGKISKNIVKDDNTSGGYLAGAFLASGSVNNPESSNYHLEISLSDENYAHWLSKILLKYKNSLFTPKVAKRRNSYVLYLKKSDQISDFLVYIGATDSCMQFENVRVDRDFSNIGNRLQICDEANLRRTIVTARKQIDDIRIIDRAIGISNLDNEKMKLLCQLRLANEESSMKELGELMSEHFDKPVSKSNINHLFRAIKDIAAIYRGKQR